MALKLIVGLGNPGRRYERTRHNIGFMAIDALAARLGAAPWRNEHRAAVARARHGEHQLLLAKPETFMNESGAAVRSLCAYHRIDAREILVISDDLDLPFGRVRLRAGGTAGGHNGLRSIIAELGAQEFPRLRMGIGRPQVGEAIDWVLAPFEASESADLPFICGAAVEIVLQALSEGVLAAMNTWNGRRDVREPVAASGPPRE